MCCSNAKWKREVVQDHKFDFVDVHEYHTTGFFTRFRYILVYVFVIKSVLVYVSDVYTAIAMLANNYWSGNILDESDNSKTISVPFTIGKWIFLGCIIFSFLLLAWESRKARMIIRSRDISYAFTNIMANNYYTMKSYDHFCFFSQIDNSKKKKDEFAFFVFFTFKGWKRLLLADAPRQVINGLTLYSFGKAFNWTTDLSKYYNGADGKFSLVRAAVLCTMIFTVVMWVGSAILLTIAAIMYIPLLCYIQGNLKEYCCHKIDKRIAELMKRKTKKRLAKEQELAKREAAGDFRHLKDKNGKFKEGHAPLPQPTLPTIDLNDAELYGGSGKSEAGHSSVGGSKYGGSIRRGPSSVGQGGGYNYPPVPSLPDTQGYPRYQLSDGAPNQPYAGAAPYGNYPYPSTNTLANDSSYSLMHPGGGDDKASIISRDPLLNVRDGDMSQTSLNRAPSYKTQEDDADQEAYFAEMQQQFGNGANEKGGEYGQYYRGDASNGGSPRQQTTPQTDQRGYFEPDPAHPYSEPPYAMENARSYSPNPHQQQQQQYGQYQTSDYPSYRSSRQQQQPNPYSQYGQYPHQHDAATSLPYQQQTSNPPSRSHTPSRSRDLMTAQRSSSPLQQLSNPSQQGQLAAPAAHARNPNARGVSVAGRSDVTTFYYHEDRDRHSMADSQSGAFDLDDYNRMSSMTGGVGQHNPQWQQHGAMGGHSGRRSQLDMLDEAEEEVDDSRHRQQQQQYQNNHQQDWRR